VVTAYDVTKKRIMRISGFNEGLANNIISWRRDQIETSFIFRTANAIQSNEMKDLQSKYQILRNSIQQKLIEAEQKLLKISQEAANLLNNLSMEVQIIIQNHEQAKADVTVIPTGL
jgi:DNA-binding helix-hairpin-helix protein with protein kinase domain